MDLPAARYILPQASPGLEDVQPLRKRIHDSSLLNKPLRRTEVMLTGKSYTILSSVTALFVSAYDNSTNSSSIV
jgi:hypothetical protein